MRVAEVQMLQSRALRKVKWPGAITEPESMESPMGIEVLKLTIGIGALEACQMRIRHMRIGFDRSRSAQAYAKWESRCR
jgi:hypothetical protein